MKNILINLLLVGLLFSSCSTKDNFDIVTPNPHQLAWAEAEIGVMFHFDMWVYQPDYEWREWGTHPDVSIFNPSALNTDQWLETAKKLGAKYAVLVAKHGSGFSLWPTEAHEYSIKNSPWKGGKGDIVADFVASCKKYNIKPAIYASTTMNGYLYVNNPGYVQKGSPVTQEEYNSIVIKQLTELWSNYGELFEIWFDGGVLSKDKGGADVLSLVQKLQPNAIAFQGPYGYPNLVRWVGNEEGVAPYPCWATADSTTKADGTVVIDGMNGDPSAPYWCPGESDFTLRWNRSYMGGWFWKEGQDSMIFTVPQLLKKYETSVGRNTNMLLGLVVDNRGLVPDADVQRAEEFGKEIERQYGKPLNQISGTGMEYTIFFDHFANINRVVIQEDIVKGERVLKYVLKGKKGQNWIELSTGTCIGHKHIVRFAPVDIEAIQLQVMEAKATPLIRNFAVYETVE